MDKEVAAQHCNHPWRDMQGLLKQPPNPGGACHHHGWLVKPVLQALADGFTDTYLTLPSRARSLKGEVSSAVMAAMAVVVPSCTVAERSSRANCMQG